MSIDRDSGGLVRDRDTGDLLELVMVMSVVTILINRAFLAMTDYPRIAFGSLHISHMLWGGLLMLVALVMVFRYWNPSVRRLAAFIAGIGFGLFIDELGKFITQDNDYFFSPTIAIIYLIFITMYLVFRELLTKVPLSMRELGINDAIREQLGGGDAISGSRTLLVYYRARNRILSVINRFLGIPKVIPTVMILFVIASLMQFAAMFGWVNPDWIPMDDVAGLSIIGALAGSTMVMIGLIRFRRSREVAAHWFMRGILVNIFVTQTFLFARSQLTAIWGLAVNLLVYACITIYIRRHA